MAPTAATSSPSSARRPAPARTLLYLLLLGLICQSTVSLPQQRGKEVVLEEPPAADSATSETAEVRQVSVRRSNAIPKSQVVKIANLTRQHDGDEFQAHGEYAIKECLMMMMSD